MAAKDKVLKQLQQVLLLRDKTAGHLNGTVGGAGAAKGQTTIPMASTTNAAVGDTVRVGSGETHEIGVIATVNANVSVVLQDNLAYDHVAGEPVVEQDAYDLGDIAEGGVTVNGSAQATDIGAATKRLAFTTLNGYTDLTAAFALPTVTMENLAIALGIAFSKIGGAGTPASPFLLATNGSEISGEQNQSLVAIGLAMDGSVLRVELWGIDVDYTGLSLALSRGALATVPVKVIAAAGGVVTTNASAYVANTTKKPTKGRTFDGLAEVGLFVDTGGGSTLAAQAAGGATSLSINTNPGGGADGTWIRVGSGDTAEFHQMSGPITGVGPYTVPLRTPLYQAQAAGASFSVVTPTPFAGVSQDGATFEVGGSVEQIRIATRRLTVGVKPGAAPMAIRFAVIDFSLGHFARALGIPQAKIVGGRLPLLGADIATDIVQGVYLKGLTQDGWTLWVIGAGCSQDVSAFAAQLTNTGTPALPMAFKPASCVSFRQHS